MGSALGIEKAAAARIGCTHAFWRAQRASGFRWCTRCKEWHPTLTFGEDRTRSDGLAAHCLASRHTGNPIGWHGSPPINPETGRPGPAPFPPREGDSNQARARVNVEVRTDRRPHPNQLPCSDCGHVWSKGERRHEWFHTHGYAVAHRLMVKAICTKCRGARCAARRTHCKHGHEFTAANTKLRGGKREGRVCLTCRRAYDRRRRNERRRN